MRARLRVFVDLCHVGNRSYVRPRNIPVDSVIKRNLVEFSRTEKGAAIALSRLNIVTKDVTVITPATNRAEVAE